MTPPPEAAAPRRARLKLLLLAALFIAPVATAYFFYYSGWRVLSVRVHGELLDPARPLSDVPLRTLADKPAGLADLKGKWSLVYFGPAECLGPCRDNLYKMQQVHLAQGREAGRVQRVFIVTDQTAMDLLRYTVLDYPGTQVLLPERGALQRLERDFRVAAGSPLEGLNRVYIVDPLGNLVLSYGADANPTGIRKDLARLLRASQVG
jgi:cytochrome oxidase Cu insertion factor (SCO1/SenC/PrrC family)